MSFKYQIIHLVYTATIGNCRPSSFSMPKGLIQKENQTIKIDQPFIHLNERNFVALCQSLDKKFVAQSDFHKNISKLFLAFSSDSPITAEGAAGFIKGWPASQMLQPQLPPSTAAAHGPQSTHGLAQSIRTSTVWERQL